MGARSDGSAVPPVTSRVQRLLVSACVLVPIYQFSRWAPHMSTRRTSSCSLSKSLRTAGASLVAISLSLGGALLGITPAFAATTAIPVSPQAVNVLASPDGLSVYVASDDSNSVEVIDAATRTIRATIAVGSLPGAMAISSDSSTLYVGNQTSQSVSVIDTATDAVSRTVQLADNINGLAISPDGQTLYIASLNDNVVIVVDSASGTIVSSIPVGGGPYGVAVSPDGATIYFAMIWDDAVGVIATATNTVTQTIPVGTGPVGVAISPSGATVYVTSGQDDAISAIDTTTQTVAHVIAVDSGPSGVVVSPDGTSVYTSNGNSTVSQISTVTNAQIASYPTGAGANRVAVSPNGKTVYTADDVDNTVSVIDVTPPAAAAITPGTPSAGTVGAAYSFTVPATGKPAPTFSVTTGTLPGGLSLVATTGRIVGTPTAIGSTTIIVTASNGIGPTSTRSYTLTVNAALMAPTITSGSPPSPQAGTAYSFAVTATGNPAPTFSVTSGALPAGLVLDGTTGRITGTPTSPGDSVFDISADNGTGVAAVGSYRVTTAADPATPTTAALATTGADSSPAGIIGGAIILVGVGLVALRRRRRALPGA
jgi:LPXTG-motif cell wall-anchored protein